MAHINMIDKTKMPNTSSSLAEDMKALGIKGGDILIVHASLSSIGWTLGGATAVVSALLNVVTEKGTIAMPAFSLENSDPAIWGPFPPKTNEIPRGQLMPHPVPEGWFDFIRENMPPYNKHITPCSKGLGIIAECFRTFPNTLRSNHPSASFTANGLHAEKIIENHPLTPNFGLNSPLGMLYKLNAKILMIGTNYDKNTSFHFAEDRCGIFPKVTHSGAVMEKGERKWINYENYDSIIENFIPMGIACEENNLVHKGKIGQANCKLLDMKKTVDFCVNWLKRGMDK